MMKMKRIIAAAMAGLLCIGAGLTKSYIPISTEELSAAAASSKNSFISLRRLFSFSNAFIRFLSCWFSSAIFRDSSGLRSPQPISRLPIYTFLIQPYSVFTGI